MARTVFYDNFVGAGALSGHTPDTGTWAGANGLNFNNQGNYWEGVTNDGSYAAEVQITGGARSIVTPTAVLPYGYEAVTESVGPDYAVELAGTFAIGTGAKYVYVGLRATLGATYVNHVGVMIYTGGDTDTVQIAVHDQHDDPFSADDYNVWESAVGTIGDLLSITLRIELVGRAMRTLVNGAVVDNRTISAGHPTTAAGGIYLLEDPDTNLIQYFRVETFADFWTDFDLSYETT